MLFDLQLELVGSRSISLNGVTFSAGGGLNLTSNANINPYLIVEYTLIDQSTGLPVTIDGFRFTQGDLDGQNFNPSNGPANTTHAWEIIGYETGVPESVTHTGAVRQAGFNGASTPAGFTTLRQNNGPSNVSNLNNDVAFEFRDTSSFQLLFGSTAGNNATFANVGTLNRNFFFRSFEGILAVDSDGDGVFDNDDLDSDNDGITDNVEAQLTADYVAPSGLVADGTFVDANMDGLDDNYDDQQAGVTGVNADGSYNHVGTGLIPVDTDSGLASADGIPDYLDLDSDNDTLLDYQEAGHGAGPVASNTVSDPSNDADNDGLFDVFEAGSTDDGYDVNDDDVDAVGCLR